MVIVYAFASLAAASATALALWPFGALVALAAAPLGASLAVLVVAVAVVLGGKRDDLVRNAGTTRSF